MRLIFLILLSGCEMFHEFKYGPPKDLNSQEFDDTENVQKNELDTTNLTKAEEEYYNQKYELFTFNTWSEWAKIKSLNDRTKFIKNKEKEIRKTSQKTKIKKKEKGKRHYTDEELINKFGPMPRQGGFTSFYYVEVITHLKKYAHDPESIDIENCTSISYDIKKGWLVGCKYRGKNGFGGKVLNYNWFIIRDGIVTETLPYDSYQ